MKEIFELFKDLPTTSKQLFATSVMVLSILLYMHTDFKSSIEANSSTISGKLDKFIHSSELQTINIANKIDTTVARIGHLESRLNQIETGWETKIARIEELARTTQTTQRETTYTVRTLDTKYEDFSKQIADLRDKIFFLDRFMARAETYLSMEHNLYKQTIPRMQTLDPNRKR